MNLTNNDTLQIIAVLFAISMIWRIYADCSLLDFRVFKKEAEGDKETLRAYLKEKTNASEYWMERATRAENENSALHEALVKAKKRARK